MAVPIYVAKIMTYPEKVTRANMKLMKTLVNNGCDTHPGANFIESRDTQFKRYCAIEFRSIIGALAYTARYILFLQVFKVKKKYYIYYLIF